MRQIEIVVDAAINGPPNSNVAFFFAGDHYVVFEWNFINPDASKGRTRDGVRPLGELVFPGLVMPLDFTPIDCAIDGQGLFAGKAYIFKGTVYQRLTWTQPPVAETVVPAAIAAWNFPTPFLSGVNAAFNGRHSREGKGYFFRDSLYLRYDWTEDHVDATYPRQIGTLIGMTPQFATGIDAAVDGDGDFRSLGYMFKLESYLRFSWAPDGGEPHVEGGETPIQGRWIGLAELLMAGRAKTQALLWITKTVLALQGYRDFLAGTGAAPINQVVLDTALSAHFRILPTDPVAQKVNYFNTILATYEKVQYVLWQSGSKIRFRTKAEQIDDGLYIRDSSGNPVLDEDGHKQPIGVGAYGLFDEQVTVTEFYPLRGPFARAAMLLHECVHIVDDQSGTPNTHIPEWYVTQPLAGVLGLISQDDRPEFATRYDLMPTSDAIHNTSSFSAFAQHVCDGVDRRYGDGRPDL